MKTNEGKGYKWSNRDTCIFIDLYKEKFNLWDPKHAEYKNK